MSYSDVSGKYQNRKATKISEKTRITLMVTYNVVFAYCLRRLVCNALHHLPTSSIIFRKLKEASTWQNQKCHTTLSLSDTSLSKKLCVSVLK